MPSRKDISVRTHAKTLARINKDKAAHPDKYIHETSDLSLYHNMKYDYEHNSLPPFKVDKYRELRKKLNKEGLI